MSAHEPNPPPRVDAELLRTFLAQRDALCPTCGYNLRGLGTERCPECATELALRLSATPPFSLRVRRGILAFAWLILTSKAIQLGIGIYWLARAFTRGFGPPAFYPVRPSLEVIVAFGLVVAVIAALFRLHYASARRDDRFRRCLRTCVILAAIHFVWIILHFASFLFG